MTRTTQTLSASIFLLIIYSRLSTQSKQIKGEERSGRAAEFGVQKTSFKAGSPGRASAQLQITCRVKKDIGGFLLQVAAGCSRLAGERLCKQAAAIREI